MKEDTKQTLGDLYAIRATMSLVAQNDDTAESSREQIWTNKRLIDSASKEISLAENNCKKQLEEYDLNLLKSAEEAELQNLQDELQSAQKKI